jgi:hypothetical protein
MSARAGELGGVRRLLLALLVDLAKDKNYVNFTGAHRRLHEFFWQLKTTPKYAPFVEDFLFDTNGNYPHAEQLDELLQELQLSGVLSRRNPTYRYNDIGISTNPSADEFKAALSSEQLAAYNEILHQFKETLGVRAT